MTLAIPLRWRVRDAGTGSDESAGCEYGITVLIWYAGSGSVASWAAAYVLGDVTALESSCHSLVQLLRGRATSSVAAL
jgi:hypothetical protein